MTRRPPTLAAPLAAALLLSSYGGRPLADEPPPGGRPRAADVLAAEGCLAFVEFDGFAAHRDAFEASAAHAAFVESGFGKSLERYGRTLAGQLAEGAGVYADNLRFAARIYRRAGGMVAEHGFAAAVYAKPGGGVMTVGVFGDFDAAAGYLREAFAGLAEATDSDVSAFVEFEEDRIVFRDTRSKETLSQILDVRGLGVVVPAEGATEADVRAVLDAGPPVSERDELPADGFLRAFADVDGLRRADWDDARFGAFAVEEWVRLLDLERLHSASGSLAFEGPAVRSTFRVGADAAPGTLFDPALAPAFVVGDLPPLPPDVAAFSFVSVEPRATLEALVANLTEVRGEAFAESYAEGAGNIAAVLGVTPEELAGAFGPLFGVYDGPLAGGLTPQTVLVARVRDADVIRSAVAAGVRMSERIGGPDVTFEREAGDRFDRLTMTVPGSPLSPELGLSEEWAVAGVSRAAVEDFFDRVAGDLDAWTVPESVLAERPEWRGPVLALDYTDTAATWRSGLPYVPLLTAAIGQATQQAILPPRLPRPAKITAPLFPNVSATVAVEGGVERRSRGSGPVFPVVAGGDVNPLTLAMGAALVLPAVQQGRESARRKVCTEQLQKQAAAALAYEKVNGHFPAGTIAASSAVLDERLAWTVSLLPFAGEAPLREEFDTRAGWASQANAAAGRANPQRWLTCPSNPDTTTDGGFPLSHFAGAAGSGEDAATLDADDPRAGVFGYDREVGVGDIEKGASATILYVELFDGLGEWTRGGRPTMRGSAAKPALNGPDGIGSHHPGGGQATMADGRVVFFNEKIDPDVFRTLMSLRGEIEAF